MAKLKRSSSTRLLSAASARSNEEPVVFRVTPTPTPRIFPLIRSFSVSELDSAPSKTASTYCPFYTPIYHHYHRDWDLGNDHRHDQKCATTPKRHFSVPWPAYSRYHPDYATSWHPSSYRHHSQGEPPRNRFDPGSRYKIDYFDSFYWRCRLDPYSVGSFPGRRYAPWSFRSRVYETMKTSEAVKMYRRGLIGYDTFEKYWIKPSGWYNHYLGEL